MWWPPRCHLPCPPRLGHPAQDPARAVHGLRPAVQRAHVRGECWHWGPRLCRDPPWLPPRQEQPPLTAPSSSAGPNGAPGHGEHHQLVAVSAELGTWQIPLCLSPSLLPPPPRSCSPAIPPWGWAEDGQLVAGPPAAVAPRSPHVLPDLLGAADTLWGQRAWQGDPQADPTACPCLPSAAYGLIVRPNDFASYLLAIGICNLLLYFAFYIIMKVGFEPWAPVGPAGRAGQGWALLPAPAHTVTPASPRSSAVANASSSSPCSASSAPPWSGALPSSSSSRGSAPGR